MTSEVGRMLPLMARLLIGLVVGAVLMDSWRVARDVGIGRELVRLRAEADRASEHRRSDIEALAGPRLGDIGSGW